MENIFKKCPHSQLSNIIVMYPGNNELRHRRLMRLENIPYYETFATVLSKWIMAENDNTSWQFGNGTRVLMGLIWVFIYQRGWQTHFSPKFWETGRTKMFRIIHLAKLYDIGMFGELAK